ncbi:signal peptide protein [Rhodopirellula maiorica SM1]|uniref:Signal peptide protein n=1 Tax=Rhodopirellula maiorica SM1 TaxID=1265738 RepID=M5S2K6_9BACT|nr:hypothetical protein [Rhodopirellula maiorica]EMI20414.1 signal peptide protein [Rhodopirellula maiorica SM1]
MNRWFTVALGITWIASNGFANYVWADQVGSEDEATAELVLIVGAGGTDEYAAAFAETADQWKRHVESSSVKLHQLGSSAISKTSDRDQLKAWITEAKSPTSTPLWIVLIGHGTYAQNVAKFNLRGPDVSASELAEWIKPLDRPMVIVNGASASGPFINALSAPGRVIVTATQSGSEHNYARFGHFFADAIGSLDADLDHDEAVSVQEAFLKANAAVQTFYESEARISSEHALIDDNGDGLGTPFKAFRGKNLSLVANRDQQLDGGRAAKMTLLPAANQAPLLPEEIQSRDAIESEIETLQSQKATMKESAYYDALELLMLKLGKLYQAADERQAAATATPKSK